MRSSILAILKDFVIRNSPSSSFTSLSSRIPFSCVDKVGWEENSSAIALTCASKAQNESVSAAWRFATWAVGSEESSAFSRNRFASSSRWFAKRSISVTGYFFLVFACFAFAVRTSNCACLTWYCLIAISITEGVIPPPCSA